MHTRYWLMSACLGLSIAGLAAQGCGSTTTTVPPDAGPADSGASDSKAADSAPLDSTTIDTAVADTAPPACAIEASIETINIPDASLGTDASVGTCLGCAKANCGMQEMTCDMDCSCKEALSNVLMCIAAKTSPILTCAEMAATNTNALSLGECLIANCEPSCGVSGKLDGGGMETSTTDAPTEAAAADGAGDSAPSEAGEQ
jgi:hypothetical protein